MNTERYNGWTNYETWNAALWLDNDKGAYSYWTETTQEVFENSQACETFTRKENAAWALADKIKDAFHNDIADRETGYGFTWVNDAINAYLSEVNWYEIAEHFLSDIEEEKETNA